MFKFNSDHDTWDLVCPRFQTVILVRIADALILYYYFWAT